MLYIVPSLGVEVCLTFLPLSMKQVIRNIKLKNVLLAVKTTIYSSEHFTDKTSLLIVVFDKLDLYGRNLPKRILPTLTHVL